MASVYKKYLAGQSIQDGRFWSKVDKKKHTECWLWLGAKKPKGYGNLRRDKKYTTAHRVAWEITFGNIPKGMQVQHSCDNPSCCNPNHLMLGTVTSNYIDMVKKNRANSHHRNRRFGESHPNHKLSSSEVKKIRELYRSGKYLQREIAKLFNVSQVLVSYINLNKGRING